MRRTVSFIVSLLLLVTAVWAAYLLARFSTGFEASYLDLGRLCGFPLSAAVGAVWLCTVSCRRRVADHSVTGIGVVMAAVFLSFLPSFTFWWHGYDAVGMAWMYTLFPIWVLLNLLLGGLLFAAFAFRQQEHSGKAELPQAGSDSKNKREQT